jgi:tRNA nucleotidyltransferase (CCA-adding enzyme)
MKIYKVGGCIRDSFLGVEPREIDWVVVGANPVMLEQLGYIPVGKNFPVFLHPETKEEYALARTEKKSGVGYKGFTFFADESVTLNDDLKRRDLTINAIAEDSTGELIDPFGGLQDLQQKVLRNTSEAFSEDPLRAFRVARLKTLEHLDTFEISDSLKLALTEIKNSGELSFLTPERIWQETEKALQNPKSSNFFSMILDYGLQDPWFNTLKEIPQLDHLNSSELKWVALQNLNKFSLGKDFLYAKTYKKFEAIAQTLIGLSTETNLEKISDICEQLNFQRHASEITQLLAMRELSLNTNKILKIQSAIGNLDLSELSNDKTRDVKLTKKKMFMKAIGDLNE